MRAIKERGWNMRKTKVRRKEVLEQIKSNYQQHLADYRVAFDQYKIEVEVKAIENKAKFLKRLEDLVAQVKAANVDKDKPVPAHLEHGCCLFGLKVPESHARDYEQVIMMLEMEVADEIELEADQFACYVMDDWDWKEEFHAVSEHYKMSFNNNTR